MRDDLGAHFVELGNVRCIGRIIGSTLVDPNGRRTAWNRRFDEVAISATELVWSVGSFSWQYENEMRIHGGSVVVGHGRDCKKKGARLQLFCNLTPQIVIAHTE